jgi:anti-sigma factor RsiW
MIRDPDHQMDLDISAFANGQLDAEQRYAVAVYLSQHPERAADVMGELHLTEGLRLVLGKVDTQPPVSMTVAASRLERSLAGRRIVGRIIPFAAAVALFACGWSAQSFFAEPRTLTQSANVAGLFESALDAQDAVRVRLSLSDELGPMPRDAAEIAKRLGIELPDLPAGWTIRATQVVATPDRPGLVIVIDTPDLGEITLFSVLRTADGPDNPTETMTRNSNVLAFFEKDRAAYVLVDNRGTADALRRSAEDLRTRFN